MTQRFQKAYDALVKAYFEGTLAKGECDACAVGNICLNAGRKLGINNWAWRALFYTDKGVQSVWNGGKAASYFFNEDSVKRALRLISKTGYTWQELAQVEYAFEANTKIMPVDYEDYSEQQILEDQYSGLAAAVEVLCRLDEIQDVEGKQKKFREHPKLITA